ncbi:1,4-dihydroxy-2-naphthoate polyprenyltransferase [Carnobacterium gallinarum]|uniref:1,4-dihydroxy-2-naphthoate polyprenyltransferase n=1 Tax=Carnobacterium gallinarum TaxID=2749 RepID=UPI000A03F403|nr:1,4-dihydroxy-2-naphthoate polyprenyltransferase [Carnobacterium gallinarum]
MGTLFAVYYFRDFNLGNTILFFAAMLIFDMTTTAINNFMDFQKAKDEGYKDQVNVIGQEKIPEKLVAFLIIFMLVVASLLGLLLVYRTDILLFFIGGICFFIGIFYTFGPVPISRMPVGELFSGVTMGFGIFFIAIYVNVMSGTLMNLTFAQHGYQFALVGNYLDLLIILLVSIPAIFTIANIMLANNLCDLDEDIVNHRYTLVFYIGRKMGVLLFNTLIYASYFAIILAVVLRIYHPIMLLTLLTVIPVRKNLATFNQKQVKSETFVLSIKNLVLINGASVILLAISLVF